MSWEFTSPQGIDRGAAELIRAAEAADRVAPLSDGVLAAHRAPEAVSVALKSNDTTVGFALAARLGSRGAAELVIHPDFRGRGLGRMLCAELLDRLEERGLASTTWAWSHGDDPAAQALADSFGYVRQRALLQLMTPSVKQLELPPIDVPPGVTIRSFLPGDEEEWLRINNAAFAWHPEQADKTLRDILDRVEAKDFDARDVFIAELDDRMAGFHDTKIHAQHPSGKRVGEVYVIAVDPTAHSRGIGHALMVAGMRDMIDRRGADFIELYVEEDNAQALGLYAALGFSERINHISYAPPAGGADTGGEEA